MESESFSKKAHLKCIYQEPRTQRAPPHTTRRPYEKGLPRCQLARLLPDGDRTRNVELANARDIFARLEARYHMRAIDAT